MAGNSELQKLWSGAPDCVDEKSLVGIANHFLSNISCLICSEIVIPPVKCCVNGHVFCYFCEIRFGSRRCQYCKASGALVVEKTLTALVSTMDISFRCRYRESGCQQSFTPSEMFDHCRKCIFRPIACQMSEKCREEVWLVAIENIPTHLTNFHSDVIESIEGTGLEQKLTFDCAQILQEQFRQYFKVMLKEKIYLLVVENVDHELVLWLMGCNRTCEDERYTLEFQVNEGKFKVKHEGLTVQTVDRQTYELLQDKGEFAILGLNAIRRWSSTSDAQLHVKLLE